MIRNAAATATEPAAAEAARAVLEAGGRAVDALIAGFLCSAGARPEVLFAPVVAIVAGFGSSGRVFDGRAAQPGRGAARPRGFVNDAEVPAAAWVGAPRSIAMLVLLSSYRGEANLRELARAGISAAEDAGAKARAKLLRQVGASGVLALRTPEVQAGLLAAGGPVAGGTLTAEDLEGATPTESEARTTVEGAATVFELPFEASLGDAEAVVACDGRGTVAALSYALAREPIEVPSLEIALGRDAVPVRRGVTRVAPGAHLPAPAAIALAAHTGGLAVALGLAGGARVDASDLGWLASGATVEAAVAELRARPGARAASAVFTDGKSARATNA